MLFSSPVFIFCFLPVVVLAYFALNRMRLLRLSLAFLLVSSLVFYAWWKVEYLPILLFSIVFNYYLGRYLGRKQLPPYADTANSSRATSTARFVLIAGIVINLGLLGYYKYTAFLLQNLNELHLYWFEPPQILLPLAISFFTFQQIAYLVDSYRGQTTEYDFFRYALFVSFFPQLIAGPIVHHREMMPQFDRTRNKVFSWSHFYVGIVYFSLGLFKKAVIADGLAPFADSGYSGSGELGALSAWVTTLSYTFELYFDFSGYCDMAIGAGRMLNIHLPINFDSPYKAANIQDFWRRWHITLSRWLRDYIYIPLGGNRRSGLRTYLNLFLTFLLGGIWHGAAWTFVLWGALHGVALALHRFAGNLGVRLPRLIGVVLTFLFVHLCWVFFRADDFTQALNMLRSLVGINGAGAFTQFHALRYLIPAVVIVFFLPNCNQIVTGYHGVEDGIYRKRFALVTGVIFLVALLAACMSKDSPFLYFNF